MWRNILTLAVTIALGAGLTYMLDYTSAVPPMAAQDEALNVPATNTTANSVPEFSFLPLEASKTVSITDLRGKIVVLNFWASWCAPCVKEFPLFLQLAAEYPEDVVFVALSSDHDNTAMERFWNKLRQDHPAETALDNVMIALDENSAVTRNTFQTFRLPETIIIDRDGMMREKLVGADWNYADLKALIEKFDTM